MSDRSAVLRNTVVVVEDEPLIRELALCELEDGGFEVVGFASADEAMGHLAHHGAGTSVLFTDVQMPGQLNGLDLAAIVARRWPAMLVLVTSGGTLVDPTRLPSRAQFVAKPWRSEDIVGRIRRLAAPPAAAIGRAAV